MAACKLAVLVVVTSNWTLHQSPSKKGKYKLDDILGLATLSGTNLSTPYLFSKLGTLPEYEPLAIPLPVYSNIKALLATSVLNNDCEWYEPEGIPLVLNLNWTEEGESKPPKLVLGSKDAVIKPVPCVSYSKLNTLCFKSQSLECILSLPPNSFILKIVSGMP